MKQTCTPKSEIKSRASFPVQSRYLEFYSVVSNACSEASEKNSTMKNGTTNCHLDLLARPTQPPASSLPLCFSASPPVRSAPPSSHPTPPLHTLLLPFTPCSSPCTPCSSPCTLSLLLSLSFCNHKYHCWFSFVTLPLPDTVLNAHSMHHCLTCPTKLRFTK